MRLTQGRFPFFAHVRGMARHLYDVLACGLLHKPAFALGRAILIEMGVSALRPTSV